MNALPAAAVLCTCAGAALAQPTTFFGTGDLPGHVYGSAPYGISHDGQVVVGHGRSSLNADGEAFRWTQAGGIQGLGSLTVGGMSFAFACSADGSVVVGHSPPPTAAFRWTAATGMRPIAAPAGVTIVSGRGVSADGSVVVGPAYVGGVPRAFRWVLTDPATGAGDLTLLNPLPGETESGAVAVSADGAVAGTSAPGGLPAIRTAVRWLNGVPAGLGNLPGGSTSEAQGISANGEFIVGGATSSSTRQPFLWSAAAGMQGLGLLNGVFVGDAFGVSNDGAMVVGGVSQAFLWRAGRGMMHIKDVLFYEYGLATPGWRLVSARAIAPDGRSIAGQGYNPANQWEGWVVRLGTPVCYANCDGSTATPALNVADFGCFLQRFAAGDGYANCDQSTTAPTLNVADFTCFLQRFAAGCS